jgi:hypothetical protein
MTEGWWSAGLERVVASGVTIYALLGVTAGLTTIALTRPSLVPYNGPFVLQFVPALLLAVALMVALRRAHLGLTPGAHRGIVLAGCGLMLVLATIGPVRNSRDLWAYVMYGRVESIHHADPYVRPPVEFQSDPFLPLMDTRWQATRTVYGPLFTWYSAVATKITSGSVNASKLAFKIPAALSVGAVLLLLADRRAHPVAIAFVGLHPAVVQFAVGGGHNDAMVGLALLGATYLVVARRPVWAGAAAAAACLIKVVTGLAVIALAVWLWHRRDRLARRDAALLAGTAGALVGTAYLMVGGVSALRPLQTASKMTSSASFWHTVRHWFGWSPLHLPVSTVALGLVLVVVALSLRRHRHDLGPEVMVTAVLLGYLVASAYSEVWYLLWVLPVAALRWRTATTWLVVAVSTAYLIPDSVHDVLQGTAAAALLLLAAASIPRPKPTLVEPAG